MNDSLRVAATRPCPCGATIGTMCRTPACKNLGFVKLKDVSDVIVDVVRARIAALRRVGRGPTLTLQIRSKDEADQLERELHVMMTTLRGELPSHWKDIVIECQNIVADKYNLYLTLKQQFEPTTGVTTDVLPGVVTIWE